MGTLAVLLGIVIFVVLVIIIYRYMYPPLDTDSPSAWDFYEGLDSPGGTMVSYPLEKNKLYRLLNYASHWNGCIAFNTDGELKFSVAPRSQWTTLDTSSDSKRGLYVLKGTLIEDH